MTRHSLLKTLPTNTVRTDVSVTAKTLWLVPVGGKSTELAVVRVLGDEPLDIVGFAKTIGYRGRTDGLVSSMQKIGEKTFVTQIIAYPHLRFVLPESNTHMDITIES